MRPDDDNTSMDSILASIRRIIASEPDPMPEDMESEETLIPPKTKIFSPPTEDNLPKARRGILELRSVVEKRQKEEDKPTTRPEEAQNATPETLKTQSTSKMETITQDRHEEALGEGFEVFLRSTLERIVIDFLQDWANQNIPRLAERILREEIKNTFDHSSAPKRRVS